MMGHEQRGISWRMRLDSRGHEHAPLSADSWISSQA